MTPDEIEAKLQEIAAKEKELQTCADELDARSSSLAQQAAGNDNLPLPALTLPATTPSPPIQPSYTTSTKLIPIILDLNDGNYTNWRELFLAALGRYGLTAHIIGNADATPSDTSPSSY